MPQPVGGLFSVGFDHKGFCADPDTRLAIEKLAASAERHTTSPLNLDKTVIDGLVRSLEAWLAGLAATPVVAPGGPLVVGAMAPVPVTAIEAQTYMTSLASTQGVVFSQAILDKVNAHPDLIRLLERRTKAYQVKLLNSAWLDTVIQWLVTYGPTIAQFLMALLPFIL